MTPWLTVIGMGCDGLGGLNAEARAALDAAEIVAGSKRQLDAAGIDAAKRYEWPSPLAGGIAAIKAQEGKRIAVLASGDPMHYGIGATLLRALNGRSLTGAMRVIPAPSAFSLAAARLGWPLQDTVCISLHGRSVDDMRRHIQDRNRVLALTEGHATVAAVIETLREMGFGASRLTLLENLGGPDERIRALSPDEPLPNDIAPLMTLAIDCVAGPEAQPLTAVPGLPDDAFVHDGMLTKREVRAVALAALAPGPFQHLWDIGAGCGSVAIEWMRAAHGATAVAIEREAARCAMIEENRKRLGTPRLEIVEGHAPEALNRQKTPDAVFIGGGVSDPAIFKAAWQALPIGGRVVANAVTLEGETALSAWHRDRGGELVRIQVSAATDVGGFRGMRPRMAVTQWRAVKP